MASFCQSLREPLCCSLPTRHAITSCPCDSTASTGIPLNASRAFTPNANIPSGSPLVMEAICPDCHPPFVTTPTTTSPIQAGRYLITYTINVALIPMTISVGSIFELDLSSSTGFSSLVVIRTPMVFPLPLEYSFREQIIIDLQPGDTISVAPLWNNTMTVNMLADSFITFVKIA